MDNNNIFLAVKAAIVGIFGAFGAAFGWLGWLVLEDAAGTDEASSVSFSSLSHGQPVSMPAVRTAASERAAKRQMRI